MKIFLIGSHRTGTSSIDYALSIMGYKVYPADLSYKLIYEIENKNYEKIFNTTKEYDVFSDSPWNHNDFYKKIDNNIKNSKIILSIRETNNWINSVQKWNNKMNLKKYDWYKSLSKTCYNLESYVDEIDSLREFYNNRNASIIDYFRGSDKLLVMNLEDGHSWNELCEILK